MGQFLSSSRPASRAILHKTDTDISDSSSNLGHPQTPFDGLPVLAKAKGHYWYPSGGPRILDACGGAGVACLGHGRRDIFGAITTQMKAYSYASYAHFKTTPVQELSDWLVDSTGAKMRKVYIMCSGSEAIEAALKLAIEYFVWQGQPHRTNFIARDESYHGTTIGSLSASGHIARREPFQSILVSSRFHRVPACNPYRQRLGPPGAESDADFVIRKAAELEAEFQRLGPDTVAAVLLEPVVGAALGCVPAPSGYLAAVRAVCDAHGALLVLDEVMCGMGRTGWTHAWQGEGEGVVPDLQTIAKGFAGGYQPASALLVGERVAGLMEREGRTFTHGHTYQNHPVVAAAALQVQRAVEREGCWRGC
ncbi:PLP-dependent transferase [Trichocladium antarcticum]|uniref:PLP-dependent transferase n=1 Tax=Trichocladium antarcticum TaxID=1450529 RepID=A0AAN6URN6_9PEZI|nr:PLP-dependent transferase [Trichocladium antarcticum]